MVNIKHEEKLVSGKAVKIGISTLLESWVEELVKQKTPNHRSLGCGYLSSEYTVFKFNNTDKCLLVRNWGASSPICGLSGLGEDVT